MKKNKFLKKIGKGIGKKFRKNFFVDKESVKPVVDPEPIFSEKQSDKIVVDLNNSLQFLQKKFVDVQSLLHKHDSLLDSYKPTFLSRINRQDMIIKKLGLNFNVVEKLQQTVLSEVKHLKKKVSAFNYSKVVSLNKQTHDYLFKLQKLSVSLEKNSQKQEQIFKAFQDEYVEFIKTKACVVKLDKSFESFSVQLDKLNERLSVLEKNNLLDDKEKLLKKKIKKGVKREK